MFIVNEHKTYFWWSESTGIVVELGLQIQNITVVIDHWKAHLQWDWTLLCTTKNEWYTHDRSWTRLKLYIGWLQEKVWFETAMRKSASVRPWVLKDYQYQVQQYSIHKRRSISDKQKRWAGGQGSERHQGVHLSPTMIYSNDVCIIQTNKPEREEKQNDNVHTAMENKPGKERTEFQPVLTHEGTNSQACV